MRDLSPANAPLVEADRLAAYEDRPDPPVLRDQRE